MDNITQPTPPAIRVLGLSKDYGGNKAVNNLSFSVPQGQTVALLGGNGAGKTTTISMLLGLLEPSSGTIELLGQPMPQARDSIMRQMNFSSPYVDLPARLTVMQNMRVYAMLYGVPQREARIEELLTDLQLMGLAHRSIGSLSAGQKTRSTLAKALINRPRLLLLDEPTASLDPDTADWIRSYLQNYQQREQATIFMASHNMAEVERMAHTVLMMKQGALIDIASPTELLHKYGHKNLEEVFLDVARNEQAILKVVP